MKHKNIFSILLIVFLLVGCYQPDKADLIIYNAKLYTCDANFNITEAIAIKDGVILQTGPNREILNGYDCDNIIDAELKPIYPGFYDAHCHFWGIANTFREVDLSGSKSFNEVISRLIEFNKNNKPNWIMGRGWDQNLWVNQSFPTKDSLDKLFPNTPILIRRIDGHAALANSKALNLANINIDTKILGGQIAIVNNHLTGLLIDNAVDLVIKVIPELKREDKLKYLKIAEKKLFEQGLTSINDAGVTSTEREEFLHWYQNNDLKINNYMMLFPDENNMDFALVNKEYDSMGLHINSIKLIADGALGSRGACLIHPYSDSLNHYGTVLRSIKKIKSIAAFASNINYQLNTHCIGDSANKIMLNIYKNEIGSKPDHRWKIEHAQIISDTDIEMFKYLGIIPSVQPTHYTSDMNWIEQRLGENRLKGAYAYKTLLDLAGIIALGTDAPIEHYSVIETFYAAITRQKKESIFDDTINDCQILSRKEALMGVTYWPAYSNFEDKQKGSLEKGKNANLVVLTSDIMTMPMSNILNTFVFQTYLNGKIVYTAE